jgi:hypothetical protein
MGVAGEIAQDLLRAAEGALAVDHPVCVPQRRQIGGECSWIDQSGMLAEELQRTCPISSTKLVQESCGVGL